MAEETPTMAPEIEETPATIEAQSAPAQLAKEVVSEGPAAEEEAETAEEAQSAPAELAPPPEETLPEPKRKPGRPSGSRNKGPAKPRAKRVVVTEPVLLPAPPPTPAEPPPRWDAQHQPIPTEAKTEMAELMLKMLQGQAMERQRRKDALRRSWFS